MDISELTLQINKTKTISDLKSVQKELNNTAKTSQNLLDTLKSIGISVGFGALLKESLQVNNQLKSLDFRLKSIFGSNVDTSSISNIAAQLNISNIAAKNLLVTSGQFAKSLNQNNQYVLQFSNSIASAAVNFGTAIGKTTTEEFNEIAKKFSKATLGEVGELKDLGIYIDVASNSFKDLVKNIQEATGATEAQAKQQAILKELLNQVSQTAGTTTTDMFDGWTQLNILMDNFKEILGGVGKIFSTTFGPVIKTLNSILEIPFVKSTAAWSIAIGSVAVGFNTLKKLLTQIAKNTKDIVNVEAARIPNNATLLDYQQQYLLLKAKELRLQLEIAKVTQEGNQRKISGQLSYTQKYMNEDSKKEYAKFTREVETKLDLGSAEQQLSYLNNMSNKTTLSLKGLTREIETWGNSLTGIDFSQMSMLGQMSGYFKEMLLGLDSNISILGERFNNASVLGYNLANAVKQNSLSFKGLFTSLKKLNPSTNSLVRSLKSVPNMFKNIGTSIKTFYNSYINEFANGTNLKGVSKHIKGLTSLLGAGLLTVFRTLLKFLPKLLLGLGKLLIVIGAVVIVLDAIKAIKNIANGKDWQEGSIMMKIAESSFLSFATGLDDELKERSEYSNKIQAAVKKNIEANKEFKKSIENMRLDYLISKMLPSGQIVNLKKKQADLGKTIIQLEKDIETSYAELKNRVGTMPQTDAAADQYIADSNALRDKRSAYKELKSSYYQLSDSIESKTKELMAINLEYADSLRKLTSEYSNIISEFSYKMVDGKFKNNSEEAQSLNRLNQLKELKNLVFLSRGIIQYRDNVEYQQYIVGKQEEYMNLLVEQKKFELEALSEQRNAAIENLKTMNAMVKSSIKLRQTSLQGISSDSMESIKLQSRQLDKPEKSELTPIIENQKAVKDIESKMLQVQNKAVSEITEANNLLISMNKNIGKLKGNTSLDVLSPI